MDWSSSTGRRTVPSACGSAFNLHKAFFFGNCEEKWGFACLNFAEIVKPKDSVSMVMCHQHGVYLPQL
jgi:hypothetical protein